MFSGDHLHTIIEAAIFVTTWKLLEHFYTWCWYRLTGWKKVTFWTGRKKKAN